MARPAKIARLVDQVLGAGPSLHHGGDVSDQHEQLSQHFLRDREDEDTAFGAFPAEYEQSQWNHFFHPLHHDDVSPPARPRAPGAMKRKRSTQSLSLRASIQADHFPAHHSRRDYNQANLPELPSWVADPFPEYFARIPQPPELMMDLDEENPYAADVELIHPALKRGLVPAHQTQEPIVVNSFIKARIRGTANTLKPKSVLSSVPLRFCMPNSLQKDVVRPPPHGAMMETVPHLPSNFGHIAKFDALDKQLFLFCKCNDYACYWHLSRLICTVQRGICDGRTLITDENTYLTQIMPIAEKSECVKHATLSLAASYVLDYRRNEKLEQRANYHHRQAVMLLDQELRDRRNFLPGKEEALIAALIILTHTEVGVT